MIINIEDAIYHKNFHLVINESNEEFIKSLEDYHTDKPKENKEAKNLIANCKGCIVWVFEPFYYIYVKRYNGDIESRGVLAHEISHFVDYVFKGAGIPITYNNTEVRAYFLEYITKQCLKALEEIKENDVKK